MRNDPREWLPIKSAPADGRLALVSFIRRETVTRLLHDYELARIPEKHRPTGPVMRSDMRVLDMPPFNRVANRAAVIFDGAEPKMIESSAA